MKRTQQPGSTRPKTRMRAIEADRLTDVRGAGGIMVPIVDPTPFGMRMQHNETFVRL